MSPPYIPILDSCPGNICLVKSYCAKDTNSLHSKSTMARFFLTVCMCLCILAIDARPPEAKGQKEDRVYDKDLSEEEHFKGDEDENHNVEYDHEAFLGKEKKKFDELTPEESKERLG